MIYTLLAVMPAKKKHNKALLRLSRVGNSFWGFKMSNNSNKAMYEAMVSWCHFIYLTFHQLAPLLRYGTLRSWYCSVREIHGQFA